MVDELGADDAVVCRAVGGYLGVALRRGLRVEGVDADGVEEFVDAVNGGVER